MQIDTSGAHPERIPIQHFLAAATPPGGDGGDDDSKRGPPPDFAEIRSFIM